MLYRRDCLNKLKYNVEIDNIKICDIIEVPKVLSIDKDFKFFRKSGIVE